MIKRKPTLLERAQDSKPVRSAYNTMLARMREELEAEFNLFAHATQHESIFHARTILTQLEGQRLH